MYNNLCRKNVSTNFTVDNKTFCLSLHYNGDNSYLFINGKEIINFKSKNSEIVLYPLCLGNISKDFDLGYMRKTGLTRYIYDFSVGYWGLLQMTKYTNIQWSNIIRTI